MAARKWGTTPNEQYEIVSLTKETLAGAVEVMRAAFFGEETVSVACELPNNPEAVDELEDMILHAIHDGVSLVAVEISTGKVAAASVNIFEFPAHDDNYFVNYQKDHCKTPNAKYLLQFMIDIANELDIFQHYQIDALLEIMFLATLQAHRGHGLAKALFQCTVDMARHLKSGDDVRTLLGEKSACSPVPKPKLVSALCTSVATQKIAHKMGFENLKMIDFNKWTFNGKKFSEVIFEPSGCSIDCFLL